MKTPASPPNCKMFFEIKAGPRKGRWFSPFEDHATQPSTWSHDSDFPAKIPDDTDAWGSIKYVVGAVAVCACMKDLNTLRRTLINLDAPPDVERARAIKFDADEMRVEMLKMEWEKVACIK